MGLERGGQGQADLAIQQHYEFDLAVALIGNRVAERVLQLGQQLAGYLDPAIFEVCATWYATTSHGMLQLLKAEEEAQPELFQAIQRHFVTRAIQVSARERLEKLATEGIVSGSTVKKLAGGV